MRKLLHFVNPVYNVNVLQSENGSVTAGPLSGNRVLCYIDPRHDAN